MYVLINLPCPTLSVTNETRKNALISLKVPLSKSLPISLRKIHALHSLTRIPQLFYSRRYIFLPFYFLCHTNIFQLREKIVRRLEDDRHQQERHQRRRVDALRSVIRHLEPPVEVTDTYDKIKPRIEKSEEYKALDSDELRQAAFDKHIRRLKEKAEERDRERERKDREKEKERDRRDRRTPRDESRNGYDSYHKPRHSRHDRDRSRHGTRTPEPDAYEAERRRAAGERERQYRRRDSSVRGSERGSRPDSRHRRDERDRTESVYDRERRERDEERERQYTRPRGDGEERRDRDEYRPRRRRGLTPEDDERDIKVSLISSKFIIARQ